MRVVRVLPDSVQQNAYLIICEPGQFTLINAEWLHQLQWVGVVDLAKATKLIEHRTQVAQLIVEGLRTGAVFRAYTPIMGVDRSIELGSYRVTEPHAHSIEPSLST